MQPSSMAGKAALVTGAAAGLGRATAINTLGAALAPVAFGVLLLPALPPGFTAWR